MTHRKRTLQEDYIYKKRVLKYKILILRFLLLLIIIGSWQVASDKNWINSFVFSKPSEILKTFITLLSSNQLLLHITTTLGETIFSFLLVSVLSILFAILLWRFPLLFSITEPYFVILNSLPKSALAPLLIVWLGANSKTIILAGLSVAIFGSILTLYSGFIRTDPDKIKLILTLGGKKKDILFKVILPSNVPLILSNMKVNIGLCLVGVIIGEFIGAKRGLGYLIIYSSQVFKMDWLLMSICVLCLIAMGLYSCIRLFEKIFLKSFYSDKNI